MWRKIVDAPDESSVPLIKVLEKSFVSGQFQFKHLSFQEYLAAAELIHDFKPAKKGESSRPVVRSWHAACKCTADTPADNSEPFWRFLVEKYVRYNVIDIDMRNAKTSVLKYTKSSEFRKSDNTVKERVLVSASPFPSEGAVNLDDCEWILDDDLVSWMKFGAHVQRLNMRNLVNITNKVIRRCAETCRDLTEIDLSGCGRVTGDVLGYFGTMCDGLLSANFNGCASITNGDHMIKFFRAVENLEKLGMRESRVHASKLQAALKYLPRLTEADFSKCLVKSTPVAFDLTKALATCCPSLTVLNLEKWAGSDRGLSHLAQLKMLTSLNLTGWSITSDGIESFLNKYIRKHGKNSPLQYVVLVGTRVTGDGAANLLDSCENLAHFDLTGLNLKSLPLRIYNKKKCSQLRTLLLRNTSITEKPSHLRFAKGMPALMTLDVSGCEWMDDHILTKVFQLCKELDITQCKIDHTSAGDTCLQALGEAFPDLDAIDLTGCRNVTDKGLATLAQMCPHLLPGSVRSRRKGLWFMKHYAQHMKELSSVNIFKRLHQHKCNHSSPGTEKKEGEKDTDEKPCPFYGEPYMTLAKQMGTSSIQLALVCLVMQNPNLTGIDLGGCSVITEEHLVFLATECPQLSFRETTAHEKAKGSRFLRTILELHNTGLTDLDLRGCPISNDDLKLVAQYCPKLKQIDIRDCPKIMDDDGLVILVKRCADLAPNETLSQMKGSSYLRALAETHPDLRETIDLRGCSHVNDSILATFVKLCPKLHPDKIVSSAKGDRFVQAVAQTHRGLQHLSLCANPKPVRVFETPHPYRKRIGGAKAKLSSFQWAEKPVSVTFDPRSDDITVCTIDGVPYYLNAGTQYLAKGHHRERIKSKLYLPGIGGPPATIPAEGGELCFDPEELLQKLDMPQSEDGDHRWGWKCVVREEPNQQVSPFAHMRRSYILAKM